MIGNQNNNEKYNVLSTKISPAMAEVFNQICDALKVDTYHIMQQFAYTFIRACSPQHQLSPEIQKVLTMLESDAAWQHAFNICNPDGLEVSQVILILEQKGKKGFGAVMVDKPFMSHATQTECVDDIVERVIEVCMKGIYRRLRRLAVDMDCQHLSDLLITMTDAQDIHNLAEADAQEMQGPNNFTDYGKEYAYGKKTKSKHRRTPDSLAQQQQRIKFKPEDTPDIEDKFKPFGGEW